MARRGMTLIEVLMAIFVMGLGLLALLTLFPLGALSMAQALKDDRVAQAAANAIATLKIWEVASDVAILDALNGSSPGDGPGEAVYLDPIGCELYSLQPAYSQHVGGLNPGIKRLVPSSLAGLRQTSAAGFQAAAHAWCMLLDDWTFGANGQPTTPVEREGLYSWAALLRRPRANDRRIEVSVIVYCRRPLGVNLGTAPTGEPVWTPAAPGTAGASTLTFTGIQLPDVGEGGWLLDASPGPGHGHCYRVAAAERGATSLTLELTAPLKVDCRRVVVLENVAEVVEKGVLGP